MTRSSLSLTERVTSLLRRTEEVCGVLADSIEGNAAYGTEKDKLREMAIEAADLCHDLGGAPLHTKPEIAMVDLDKIRQALNW